MQERGDDLKRKTDARIRIRLIGHCAVALTFVFAQSSFAQEQGWNGTWKLNEAKSSLTGTVQEWKVTDDGWWKIDIANVRFEYKCDGKPYTVFQGRTLVCHQLNPQQIDTVVRAGNDLLAHSIRTLSDQDMTMRVDESGKTADGASFQKTEVLKKISGGKGWTGTWRETSVQNSANDLMVIQCKGDSIRITYPVNQSNLTTRLDGSPSRSQGPHATDIDVRLKSAGPRTITEVESENGKQIDRDTLTLRPDGKVLIVESRQSGDTQKQIYVYDKQ